MKAGGILAVVDDGQGWLGCGLPSRASGCEADGEIQRQKGFTAARRTGKKRDRPFGKEPGEEPVERRTGDVEEIDKVEDALFHN